MDGENNGGTRGFPPKWMVKVMENPWKPYEQMDDLEVPFIIFGNTHLSKVTSNPKRRVF